MPRDHDIVFYDGTCGLCHRTVKTMVKADRDGRQFLFAPIGGQTWQEQLSAQQRGALPESVVILTREGQVHVKADAVRYAARRLGGRLAWLERVMGLFPRSVQRWGYEFVARHRKQWFGTRDHACPVVPDELRKRFRP